MERPLIQLLDQLGGWPILRPDWDPDKFDWLLLTAQLRLYNNDVLISEWVGPDIKNSDKYVIQVIRLDFLSNSFVALPQRDSIPCCIHFIHYSLTKHPSAFPQEIISYSGPT